MTVPPCRTDTLTSREVAALVGIHRTHVAAWCARRGISRVRPDGDNRYFCPAAAVYAAYERETGIPADLRLRRWVARALIA